MKTQFMAVSFILLFFMISCSSSKTTPSAINEITRKIESKDFTIVVNYAYPFRMRPVYLTSDYDLKIKNDSAFAFLPYYGVAQIAPYNSGEGGIKFAEPITNYSIVPNKKHNGWKIQFKVQSKTSTSEIFMQVFNDGNASFSVSSSERDAITFNGEIKR